MRKPFLEEKATQVAARFLAMEGGSIGILKLVKLVYLVDRESLLRYGRPVTFDHFFSMAHGPVVSSTLDCINATEEEEAPYWLRHISARDGKQVRLVNDPGVNQLSPAVEALIDDVYREWGGLSTWALRDRTHELLPEWQDPAPDKRVKLSYKDVLKIAGGWSDEEVKGAIADLKAEIAAFG